LPADLSYSEETPRSGREHDGLVKVRDSCDRQPAALRDGRRLPW